MSDSGAIDAALIAKLLGDATLAAFLPDGVYVDVANPGATRFIIVALLDEDDEPVLGGRGYEDALYLVKAVARSSTGADVRAAAARIDALLEDQPLTIAGYGHMVTCREKRVRITERDEVDASIRWLHFGGHYRIQATPN